MKLSKREQVLLALLLVVGLIAAGYYFLFQPMWMTLQTLNTQRLELQTEYDLTVAELKQIEPLKAQVAEHATQIDNRTKRYFPSIIQEKIILMLNQLYADSVVLTSSEAYVFDVRLDGDLQPEIAEDPSASGLGALVRQYKSDQAMPAQTETTEAEPVPEISEDEQKQFDDSLASVEGLTVSIDLTAPYANVIEYIRQIESLDRTVQIASLNLAKSEATTTTTTDETGATVTTETDENLVSCQMELVFYAIPKLTAQDDDYESWTISGVYGKEDPFVAVTE